MGISKKHIKKDTKKSRQLLLAMALLMTPILSMAPVMTVNAADKLVQAGVNINTADVQVLSEQLNGIGEAKAKAIISFRKKNGPFRNASDLTQVNGIGESIVVKNAGIIVVK